MRTFHARIADFIAMLIDRHPAQTVLIVTHGGVLDIVHRIARGLPLQAPRDFAIPNAAINWISYDGAWTIETWGERVHLATSRDELPNA